MQPEKYLKIYQEHFDEVMRAKPSKAVWSYGERTVRITWEISYKAIHETSPRAADLLTTCSFLSNEGIRDDIFRLGMMLGDDGMLFDMFWTPSVY
jgi:hypothetical protein